MRIVADSSCDLYHFEGVSYQSVPMKILTAEKEFIDVEGLDVVELVDVLKSTKEKTTTSCPNINDYKEAFNNEDEVIVFTITSQLSGSYNAAKQAADIYMEENPGKKVHVFDTRTTGPEMRILMERVRNLLNEGKVFEEIVAHITEYMRTTRLIFVLENMQNLARNGRVSPLLAKITEAIGIRFIGRASIIGTLEQMTIAKGAKRTTTKIFESMKKLGYNGGKCRITHILNVPGATALMDLIHSEYPAADVSIDPCTALCTYYAEDGGLLLGFEVTIVE